MLSTDKFKAVQREKHEISKIKGSDPPGSRLAHDTFTTKNRSRWISLNFVRNMFTTDFYSRLVRDKIMFVLVANES
jgi:hypothetical protein